MPDRPAHITRLTSTPREMEAGIIVAALQEQGIRAVLTGATTAGFRAEAPGWVQVLVAEEDVPRAEEILRDVREHRDEVDWSNVDVGVPEEEIDVDSLPWLTSLRLWRRVAIVVVLIYLIWFGGNFAMMALDLVLRLLGLRSYNS